MDNKIDCTVSKEHEFHVILLSIDGHGVGDNITDVISQRLTQTARIKVSKFDQGSRIQDFYQLLNLFEAVRPQALVIISRFDRPELAQLVAYQYNNTFHNSPNILFGPHEIADPLEVFEGNRSFDLAVTKCDVDALVSLVLAISDRETEDSPIIFDRLRNVLYRQEGKEGVANGEGLL